MFNSKMMTGKGRRKFASDWGNEGDEISLIQGFGRMANQGLKRPKSILKDS